jgi:hypothetical protein
MYLLISSSMFVVKTSSSCPIILFLSMWKCKKYNGYEGKLVCRKNMQYLHTINEIQSSRVKNRVRSMYLFISSSMFVVI